MEVIANSNRETDIFQWRYFRFALLWIQNLRPLVIRLSFVFYKTKVAGRTFLFYNVFWVASEVHLFGFERHAFIMAPHCGFPPIFNVILSNLDLG